MSKVYLIIVLSIIFLAGCGKSDNEKYLEGKWESENDSEYTVTYKSGKEVMSDGEEEFTNNYEIEGEDKESLKDLIIIATDGSEFDEYFSGYTHRTIYGKSDGGNSIIFKGSYLQNDETGEIPPEQMVDGNEEKLVKVSSGEGFSWSKLGGFAIGIVILIYLVSAFTQKDSNEDNSVNSRSNNKSSMPQPPKKNSGKVAVIIISILVFILLIAALLFGAYKLFLENDNSESSNNSSQSSNSQNDDSADGSNSGDTPEIDVLSDIFNTNFMNQDNRQNYGYPRLGMSKDELEDKFNSSGEKVIIDGNSAVKYGNIAINYIDGNIRRIFVAPDDVSINEFKEFHGEPTHDTEDGVTIYDDNSDNAYSIKVYSDDNGKVKGIENVEAIEANEDDSADDNDTESVNIEDD